MHFLNGTKIIHYFSITNIFINHAINRINTWQVLRKKKKEMNILAFYLGKNYSKPASSYPAVCKH
jgi:hypothetical protein